jgi:hypothetical protein
MAPSRPTPCALHPGLDSDNDAHHSATHLVLAQTLMEICLILLHHFAGRSSTGTRAEDDTPGFATPPDAGANSEGDTPHFDTVSLAPPPQHQITSMRRNTNLPLSCLVSSSPWPCMLALIFPHPLPHAWCILFRPLYPCAQ